MGRMRAKTAGRNQQIQPNPAIPPETTPGVGIGAGRRPRAAPLAGGAVF